jgi:hypothetical protein
MRWQLTQGLPLLQRCEVLIGRPVEWFGEEGDRLMTMVVGRGVLRTNGMDEVHLV